MKGKAKGPGLNQLKAIAKKTGVTVRRSSNREVTGTIFTIYFTGLQSNMDLTSSIILHVLSKGVPIAGKSARVSLK